MDSQWRNKRPYPILWINMYNVGTCYFQIIWHKRFVIGIYWKSHTIVLQLGKNGIASPRKYQGVWNHDIVFIWVTTEIKWKKQILKKNLNILHYFLEIENLQKNLNVNEILFKNLANGIWNLDNFVGFNGIFENTNLLSKTRKQKTCLVCFS